MLGSVDRAQRHIFPPTLDELLPADHPARFFVLVVEELDLEDFEKEFSDSRGRRGYPPSMLIALWLYCYATRMNSSRKLEESRDPHRRSRFTLGANLVVDVESHDDP